MMSMMTVMTTISPKWFDNKNDNNRINKDNFNTHENGSSNNYNIYDSSIGS